MIACAILLGLLAAGEATAPTGTAMHYQHKGAMARVAAIRHEAIAWDWIDGLASLPSCHYVNPKHPYFVRARFWEYGHWGRVKVFQVVDCSAAKDIHAQMIKGIVPYGIEVDRGTADAGGWAWNGYSGAGRTRVRILRIWQP